jgi:hypothetical protein
VKKPTEGSDVRIRRKQPEIACQAKLGSKLAEKAKFNYDDEMIYQMFVLCHQSASHNIFSRNKVRRARSGTRHLRFPKP